MIKTSGKNSKIILDENSRYEKNEKYISLLLCNVIVFPIVLSVIILSIRRIIILPLKLDVLLAYSYMAILIFLTLKSIIQRIFIEQIVLLFLFSISLLITTSLNWIYWDYYRQIAFQMAISVPWLFCAGSLRNYSLYKKYLSNAAFIITLFFGIQVFVLKKVAAEGVVYSQGMGYAILPSVIISISILYDAFNKYHLINLFISMVFLLSMGARGPIMCVVLYVILKFLVMFKTNSKKALLISCILSTMCIIIYMFFYDIMSHLITLFQNLNLSTRAVSRLITGDFMEDKSRNILSGHSINLIFENPLTGVGLGNDRILLSKRMGIRNILVEAVGWYPHNIFLELLLHFGIFIGGFLIIYMIRVIYISIFKSTNKDLTDIICIFIAIGFFPLLFSGSYVTSSLFFVLIGLCLHSNKIRKFNKV